MSPKKPQPDSPNSENHKKISKSGGAFWVGLGILLSRIMGLIRQKIFAFYFGNSDLGDAFYAALKIPNFMQNLLGDGVLSASLIPVYAKLRAEGQNAEADKVAGVVGTWLALVSTVIVGIGIAATPLMIDLIAPGFEGEKRLLTIQLVQIFFPGTGLLVMSAWCLGILNSHRKFFLSYAAPVIWNLTIIAALIYYGRELTQDQLVIHTAYAVVVGSLLQFLIQLPSVLTLAGGLRAGLSSSNKHVKQVFKNFTPVVASRGVVQLSAYVDNILASLLMSGAVSTLAYAQSIYLLPFSLFGMSVSAAELPTMSEATGDKDQIAKILQARLRSGLSKIAFFVIPSMVGFLFVGDVIVRALYFGGQFDERATQWVWMVLIGYTVGLLSTTQGRLYSSAFYALNDTKTPFKFATIRVLMSAGLGYLASMHGPELLGMSKESGVMGLTAAAGISGMLEYWLLKHSLEKRIGKVSFPAKFYITIYFCALLAGAAVFVIKNHFVEQNFLNLALVLSVFGIIYFSLGALFGLEEPRKIFSKVWRKIS
jgi:putative peptidoglycan lipid II flippase